LTETSRERRERFLKESQKYKNSSGAITDLKGYREAYNRVMTEPAKAEAYKRAGISKPVIVQPGETLEQAQQRSITETQILNASVSSNEPSDKKIVGLTLSKATGQVSVYAPAPLNENQLRFLSSLQEQRNQRANISIVDNKVNIGFSSVKNQTSGLAPPKPLEEPSISSVNVSSLKEPPFLSNKGPSVQPADTMFILKPKPDLSGTYNLAQYSFEEKANIETEKLFSEAFQTTNANVSYSDILNKQFSGINSIGKYVQYSVALGVFSGVKGIVYDFPKAFIENPIEAFTEPVIQIVSNPKETIAEPFLQNPIKFSSEVATLALAPEFIIKGGKKVYADYRAQVFENKINPPVDPQRLPFDVVKIGGEPVIVTYKDYFNAETFVDTTKINKPATAPSGPQSFAFKSPTGKQFELVLNLKTGKYEAVPIAKPLNVETFVDTTKLLKEEIPTTKTNVAPMQTKLNQFGEKQTTTIKTKEGNIEIVSDSRLYSFSDPASLLIYQAGKAFERIPEIKVPQLNPEIFKVSPGAVSILAGINYPEKNSQSNILFTYDYNLFENVKSPTTKTNVEIIQENEIGNKNIFEPIQIQEPSTAISTITSLTTKTRSTTAQQQAQAQAQQQEQIQEQIRITSTITTKKIKQTSLPISEPIQRKEPFIPIPNIKPKDDKTFSKGFDVYAKIKGQFKKVNVKPLAKSQALSFGARFVGNSPSATFKLKETQASVLDFKKINYGLQDFYKKGALYIEKRERRIKSQGEKLGITFRGLQKLRLEKTAKKIWRL